MTEKTAGSPRFYRRDAAADYLRDRWGQRTSTKTMAKWACQGGGPPMSYSGRFPIYEETDLDAFARNRMRGPFNSTTEATAAEKRQPLLVNADDPRLLDLEAARVGEDLRVGAAGVGEDLPEDAHFRHQ